MTREELDTLGNISNKITTTNPELSQDTDIPTDENRQPNGISFSRVLVIIGADV